MKFEQLGNKQDISFNVPTALCSLGIESINVQLKTKFKMEDKVQVSNPAKITQNCLLCAVRPDLVDCGLRIPVGDGYEYITEDDYQNFPYRWVGDDIFQVFFKGEWKNAYSADFVFV